jgi:murein L,D-transpeptidase YcbB/YkuD
MNRSKSASRAGPSARIGRAGALALIAVLWPCLAGAAASLWSSANRPTPAAVALLEEMSHAEARALDPADYDTERLGTLIAQARTARDGAGWTEFDRAMSTAAARFVSDLHFGRIDPASVGHHLTIDREALDVRATLEKLAATTNPAPLLDELEPQFEHYALLKAQLARYRILARDPGLTDLPALPPRPRGRPAAATLPAPSRLAPPSLTDYPGSARLARLLAALGDLPTSETTSTPSPAVLSAALRRFQHRHGIEPDGVLGAATFAELTRPLTVRLRQIELTLERWRWLPHKLPSAPIIVNIPQFHLYAFASRVDTERDLVQMDVIVGKAFQATQTPVFTADLSYLVFRPYWDVPIDIARRELVPAARRDPRSLERNGLELVHRYDDPPGSALPPSEANLALAARGSLLMRQRPGPDNALGLVKFMMPNPYNVYLHSTPARALFGQSRRAFSHGCIRVSDPVGLAEYVLRDAPDWNRERILAAMNESPAPRVVHLPHPIRVFVVYGTALATETGDTFFFDDIYGQDARLEQALAAHHLAIRSASPL